MSNKDTIWEDVIISILSVYSSTLEKTFARKPKLAAEGLLDIANLMKWTSSEIVVKLSNAWPERAGLNNIFADRLEALGQYLKTKDLAKCHKVLSGKDKKAIADLLLPIKGVGPMVLNNFFSLRELQ